MTTTVTAVPVRFLGALPEGTSALGLRPSVVLIYDEKLDEIGQFNTWKLTFGRLYGVSGGESLKDISAFPTHIESILGLVAGVAPSQTTIIAAGGGSVGDFGGFVASVLKRGVALVHMPTTWLAALDSAHGGKTALNVGGFKNQIGTFHVAEAVWIVKPLLEALPAENTRAAKGELLKMAMLLGGDLFDAVAAAGTIGPDEFWALLPAAINGKIEVVAADPREETGYRRVLNLGHTLGHPLESHYGLAHGVAVGCGLRFAVAWSRARGYLTSAEVQTLEMLLDRLPESKPGALPREPALDRRRLEVLLRHDKKSAERGRVHFVFLESIGRPFVKEVSIAEIVAEAERQGWL